MLATIVLVCMYTVEIGTAVMIWRAARDLLCRFSHALIVRTALMKIKHVEKTGTAAMIWPASILIKRASPALLKIQYAERITRTAAMVLAACLERVKNV